MLHLHHAECAKLIENTCYYFNSLIIFLISLQIQITDIYNISTIKRYTCLGLREKVPKNTPQEQGSMCECSASVWTIQTKWMYPVLLHLNVSHCYCTFTNHTFLQGLQKNYIFISIVIEFPRLWHRTRKIATEILTHHMLTISVW